MSNRKVAYIQTVERIDDIEGKDNIKHVKLLNNGFMIIHNIVGTPINVGDKVVYIEYDSLIEPCATLEFLRKRCWSEKRQKFHLKVMKMASVLSYGLILTLDQATNIIQEHNETFNLVNWSKNTSIDGYDLSKNLNIIPIDDAEEVEQKPLNPPMTKWQRFIKKYAYFIWRSFYGKNRISGNFPSICANKTDETRCQNLTRLFNDEYKNIPVYITQKIDGQSFTASIWKNKFYIASRNLTKYCQPLKKAVVELKPSNEPKLGKYDDFIAIACKYDLAMIMTKYCKENKLHNITMQAEYAGPGIQQNRIGLKEKQLYVFNLYNPDIKRFYGWDDIVNFAKKCDIDTVPLIERTFWKWSNVEELEEYSKGTYPNGLPQEGIVIRRDELDNGFAYHAESGMSNLWSLKCISPDYDLKYNC